MIAEDIKKGEDQYTKPLLELRKKVDYEAASLFLIEPETQSLKEIATVGDGIDFIGDVNFSMGPGLSAWVAQKSKEIYLPDIHRGSRHGLNPIRSYLSLPLHIEDGTVGVLNLCHLIPKAFSGKKLSVIKETAATLAQKLYTDGCRPS